MKKQFECIIFGDVQGVFFRDFAKEHADKLGLTGFAENKPDDTVLIVAQGVEKNLQNFIEIIKQGPQDARIEKVEINWKDNPDTFLSFEARY